ncbi:hypothetical protein F4775DRAFT_584592 [Biscogniauxia sp. FL1348]|nr:hypothetical protein F4775DRAFT_584592 [Biscogniauxia sp. FL1348]
MPSPINDALGQMKRSFWDNRSLPPVRLSNPATEFVDNRVAIKGCKKVDIDTIESSPQLPDHLGKRIPAQEDGPVPQEREEEDAHCKQFAEALQSFESSLPDKYKTRFNLQDKHNWSEVIEEATIAEMKYKKKAGKESPFGKVRGFFRSLQKKSAAVEGWLEMLPTQSEYGSLICGGCKMILRAAARMDEIREFIVKAMAAIPDEVEKAQLIIDYNRDLDTSRRLYRSVSSLYHTVFGVLEHIITWYSRKSAARHLKSVLQQGTYEKELEEKVNIFKAAVAAVKAEAELCGLRRLSSIQEDVRKILLGVEEFLRSNPRLHPKTAQALKDLYIQPPTPKRKAISRQSLCESVLRYEEDIPSVDLTAVMHQGSELSLKEQDRIVYVIESQSLRGWLLNPKNAVLLVRGNSDDLDSGGTAMSFVAGHVIQSTRQAYKGRLLCLYWFAGQHRNVRNDANASVDGIMRSLIGQLLYMYSKFDLYFIKRNTAVAMHEGDLEVLCDVFDELIYQLPERTVVFIVIDWLACLEYHHRDDVEFLLGRLHAITRHARGKGSLFKLLLTHNGGAFRGAAKFDGPGEILDVPEDGDGNRMGFNKLMWDTKVSTEIDQLADRSKRQKYKD